METSEASTIASATKHLPVSLFVKWKEGVNRGIACFWGYLLFFYHAKRIALLLTLCYAGGQALKRSAPFLKGVQAGILMEKGKRKLKESEPVQKLKELADK